MPSNPCSVYGYMHSPTACTLAPHLNLFDVPAIPDGTFALTTSPPPWTSSSWPRRSWSSLHLSDRDITNNRPCAFRQLGL